MNKYRLFYILEILKNNSDEKNYISSEMIIEKLKNEYNINAERKTIFDDIKALNNLGFNIESKPKKGFFIEYFIFETYEIKMLLDGIDSMLNINPKEYDHLKNKLLSFLSSTNRSFINNLISTRDKRHSNAYGIAMILEAIFKEEYLIVTTAKQNDSYIIPFTLYFDRGYYYLYYAYKDKPKRIYTIRLDRIIKLSYSNEAHHQIMLFDECQRRITYNVNNYYKDDEKWLDLIILSNEDYIINNLSETFKIHTITKYKNTYKFSLKASISNELYATLCKYSNNIKILDEQYRNEYLSFLNSIITSQNYQP